jgi:beta-lactamase superfamily II metal-dependent hydrolase
MAEVRKGCGPVFLLLVLIGLAVGGFFAYRWYKKQGPPPPSGAPLQVLFLDVGQGDSILIVSPTGKTMLIGAGDKGRGAGILDVLREHNITKLDYFVATHPRTDHIGGADEVFVALKPVVVIDSGIAPPERVDPKKKKPPFDVGEEHKPDPDAKPVKPGQEFPTVIAYDEFENAVAASGAKTVEVTVGETFDLGGGARITVLGPSLPLFTHEQLVSAGGNMLNANSIMLRLDYGDFSLMLPGDAEGITEQRLLGTSANLAVKGLKVAHHGSKYATTQGFLDRLKPEFAVISTAATNKYGHPGQAVMDRLKAANVKVFRTDLQGTITLTTTGVTKDGKLYDIKPERQATADIWAGREQQKDDSERAGFVAYGDYERPKPKPPIPTKGRWPLNPTPTPTPKKPR